MWDRPCMHAWSVWQIDSLRDSMDSTKIYSQRESLESTKIYSTYLTAVDYFLLCYIYPTKVNKKAKVIKDDRREVVRGTNILC